MLKKSCLLEYLMSYADTLKNYDGKKALSSDYFMLAVLKTVDEVENNQAPEAIQGEDAMLELLAVNDMLSRYKLHPERVIESISATVTASDYVSTMDEFIFGKILFTVEDLARKRGEEMLDTTQYLELILREPTPAITKFVLNFSTTLPPEEARATPPEDVDVIRELLEKLAAAEAAVSEKPDCREEPDVNEGRQRLSAAVQTTRHIRNTLLESVFGQDQAVNTFVSGYFRAQLMACCRGETPRPQATFLFAGPPGVGKTFLAEKAAEALGLPYRRFDMSEYADKEANLEFCGSDMVYKNGKPGNVTGFVAEHPSCVLLFDEIEKAHIHVIYLFLQMLDAGRLRDNYTDKEVSFTNAVIILTTNAGKNLYDDPSIVNLAALPRKKVLKALTTDVNPLTGTPLFPPAICSRFASGNVVMFNHLDAGNLYTITKRELLNNVRGFEETTGIRIHMDERVPGAILFSEGGKADARTVKGRANAFFHDELYELFRLLAANHDAVTDLKQINLTVPRRGLAEEVATLFDDAETPEVLIIAEGDIADECVRKLSGSVVCHRAVNVEEAKAILFDRDVRAVLCDVGCGVRRGEDSVLNLEDVDSDGRDALSYVLETHALPVYLLQSREGDISHEEFLSFAALGVRDVLTVKGTAKAFAKEVLAKCEVAYRQSKMLCLARESRALTYKTAQTVSKNRRTAHIRLFDCRLSLITDTQDSKRVVDSVSRPRLHFEDVIGAEDAKQELRYFVEYLKNPVKYMRKGVRSPKGVLLYGPPGTGKTLLAKAMAGESGVTFLKAEGNEFLKRYVGDGAAAVHDLFNTARKYAPSVIFIDEIDSIAKNRGEMVSEDHTSDVMAALLTELDGFETDTTRPVFLLAATNFEVDSAKGRSLDAALLRRFDRRIRVDLPNREERLRYLHMKISHAPSMCLSQEQLEQIASRSTGMSLADLESVLELALRSAIRSDSGTVGDAELEEAFETFRSGEKRAWSPEALERTARHEAGHALVCWMSGERPSYVTVVARDDHGGYMQRADNEDKATYTKSELLSIIRTALGGRAAEMVYYGSEEGISTGAVGDLHAATHTAEQMLCRYGMDNSVGMAYTEPDSLGGAVGQMIRDRVNGILSDELNNAARIIRENKLAMDTMVQALLEKSHLKENEIDEIFSRTARIA